MKKNKNKEMITAQDSHNSQSTLDRNTVVNKLKRAMLFVESLEKCIELQFGDKSDYRLLTLTISDYGTKAGALEVRYTKEKGMYTIYKNLILGMGFSFQADDPHSFEEVADILVGLMEEDMKLHGGENVTYSLNCLGEEDDNCF